MGRATARTDNPTRSTLLHLNPVGVEFIEINLGTQDVGRHVPTVQNVVAAATRQLAEGMPTTLNLQRVLEPAAMAPPSSVSVIVDSGVGELWLVDRAHLAAPINVMAGLKGDAVNATRLVAAKYARPDGSTKASDD